MTRAMLGVLLLLSMAMRAVAVIKLKHPPGKDFKTEPTFHPEKLHVKQTTDNPDLLGDGYFFMAPVIHKAGLGPQIYDREGNLIWWGEGSTTMGRVQNFRVCDFLGETGNHVCWHEQYGRINDSEIRSEHRFFDNTYSPAIAGQHNTAELQDWPNGHESNMLRHGERYMQVIFHPKPMDLRQYRGPQEGFVTDGCFQEVDVLTGEVVFTWCYLDHLPIWETKLWLHVPGQKNLTSQMAGTGSEQDCWDFIHMNSADKNEEGDYLVSGRHLDQILKIAGSDNVHGVEAGTVLWRLGGTSNDFELEGFLFSKQHHVRFQKTTADETVISVFNNAWEGSNRPTSRRSSGLLVGVNNVTMKARLLQEYPNPDGKLSNAQGSMQVLPNDNVLIAWGGNPQITEFDANGTVLYHATFSNDEKQFDEWNYRVYKGPWTAFPTWKPKLLAYARTCSFHNANSPLVAYVSWNGATEAQSWRFYTSNFRNGPWLPAGTVPRDGFETMVDLSHDARDMIVPFIRYVSVEALDANGHVLGSATAETFVPNQRTAGRCDEDGCDPPGYFRYIRENSCAALCGKSFTIPILAAICLFSALELIVSAAQRTMELFVSRSVYRRYVAV